MNSPHIEDRNCKFKLIETLIDDLLNLFFFFSNYRAKFLRTKDRDANNEIYPALHYPEIYLLDGGYKEFFKYYTELCDPNTYLPMLEPAYDAYYKHFRAATKSWNGDRGATLSRLGKSRSRLLL